MRLKLIQLYLLLTLPSACLSQTDSTELYSLLDTIVSYGNRNYKDTAALNGVGDFIYKEFEKYSSNVYRQEVRTANASYFNVIATLGDTSLPRIVVGAHYDVCGNQEGADDNGSGVVGLITCLKNLKDYQGEYCLEFVAYTLEEPPMYRTSAMGSYVHAQWLNNRGVEVYGMLCLEMIGYFSDEKKSQSYPIGLLKLFYGGKGDYITLVRKMKKGQFTRRFSRMFAKTKQLKTKKFTAPRKLTGIDFSDHRNYWDLEIDALMITDTSFYRNANYHQTTDTMETLDYARMADVVNGVIQALGSF